METDERDAHREEERLAAMRRMTAGALPPVFPKWMRDMDPFLKLEDTNVWLEAFRRRRLYKIKRSPFSRLTPRDTAGIYMIVGSLFLMVLLLSPFSCFIFLTFCILFWLGAILSQFISRKRRLFDGSLPMTLGQVFGKQGYHIPAIIDLWQCGAGGRDLLEAIYLEKREIGVKTFSITGLLIALIMLGTYLAILHFFVGGLGALMRPQHIVGVMLLLWSAREIMMIVWVSKIDTIINDTIVPVKLMWEGNLIVGHTILHNLLQSVVWFVGLMFLILAEFAVWSYLITRVNVSESFIPWLVCLNVMCLLVVLIFVRVVSTPVCKFLSVSFVPG